MVWFFSWLKCSNSLPSPRGLRIAGKLGLGMRSFSTISVKSVYRGINISIEVFRRSRTLRCTLRTKVPFNCWQNELWWAISGCDINSILLSSHFEKENDFPSFFLVSNFSSTFCVNQNFPWKKIPQFWLSWLFLRQLALCSTYSCLTHFHGHFPQQFTEFEWKYLS